MLYNGFADGIDQAIEEAGVLAVEAGCDVLLVCSDLDAAARVRDTLATEAERSPAFQARLRQAKRRADVARRAGVELDRLFVGLLGLDEVAVIAVGTARIVPTRLGLVAIDHLEELLEAKGSDAPARILA